MSLQPVSEEFVPQGLQEEYEADDSVVRRRVFLREGSFHETMLRRVTPPAREGLAPSEVFWDEWLEGPAPVSAGPDVTVVDLFSGCGGLSLGASEAIRATGKNPKHVFALDNNFDALEVFRTNFSGTEASQSDVNDLVPGEIGDSPGLEERRLARNFEGLDLLIGGPPCQGNSDLNNHTRRADPKNLLYLKMVRFAEVVRPRHVLIENVPGVMHAQKGVVHTAEKALMQMGYHVSHGILNAAQLGGAQARRRHILLASRVHSDVSVDRLADDMSKAPRPVLDAIARLGESKGGSVWNTSAKHYAQNERRMKYMFEHELYELPDDQRPDCHRLKPHRYQAVYGRMYPHLPAPTITAGFGSTGQGRFVHPLEPRTLTPQEAARVQGFPGWFNFSPLPGRRSLQQMIGNAVPTMIAYTAAMELVR
ncbi:DNA cytosine methyltransferase [Arthrobacter cupressi]